MKKFTPKRNSSFLSGEQKNQILKNLWESVEDPVLRAKIIACGEAYEETGEGSKEEMIWYLSQPENIDSVDDIYTIYVSSSVYE